jgi:hypothetical protein
VTVEVPTGKERIVYAPDVVCVTLPLPVVE